MAQSVMFISDEEKRESQKAADYLHNERGVKVDAKRIGEAIATVVKRISAGWKLATFATQFNATRMTPKGKVVASRPMQLRWRLAEYIHATRDHQDFREQLEAGYGMTADNAGKLCSDLKPALIEAGIEGISNKGRTTDDVHKRAAQATVRAAKRLQDWQEKGIKATQGARADIPPFPAVKGFQMALDGASVETLTTFYQDSASGKETDKPASPRVRRPGGTKATLPKTGTDG